MNPRYPFGVHTISSRARYDHFDTAPYVVTVADSFDIIHRFFQFVKNFFRLFEIIFPVHKNGALPHKAVTKRHTNHGDRLMNDMKMLTGVLHTVQMGQSGIRCVIDKTVSPELKQEMRQQLQVYDAMESEALKLGMRKGWQLKDIHPGILRMSEVMANMRLIGGQRDSKIAGMLIQGNTRGVILGSKNLHHHPKADPEIQDLTRRMITQEKNSIENTQRFL